MTEVNILIVEDNPGDIRLMKEALGGLDFAHQIETVSDGVAALDFLYQRESYVGSARPDLILLDINLPKANGYEVLKSIKSNEGLGQIPVFIISSSTADRDIMRSYNLDADG